MQELRIDPKVETKRITDFISSVFREKGFGNAVIGISGGLDSAVVCNLLVSALGNGNVRGIFMPNNEIESDESTKYAEKTFLSNNLTMRTKHIMGILKGFIDYLADNDLGGVPNDIRDGNLQARIRMSILYDIAHANNALVVGTGNKTEFELGYFTIYGDGVAALMPIAHLYKTQVRQLAEYLRVPKEIMDRKPSAGLWEGQTDEDEIGASYEDIDMILYCHEKGLLEKDLDLVYQNFENGRCNIKKTISNDTVRGILGRAEKNRFKSNLPCRLQ